MNPNLARRFSFPAAMLFFVAANVVAAATPAPAVPRAAADAATAPRGGATRFHFNDMPVRSALQLLAEEGGVNIVVSDAVQGTVTLQLEGVTWEQALAVVLRVKGLRQQVDGSTRSVSPGD
jgi:type IV pilus assembly protein PilQ